MFRFLKKNKKSLQHRPVRMEALERREVFAGNIMATYTPATQTLALTGDGMDNAVLIRPVAGGNIRIDGQAGTTINGAASLLIPSNYLNNVTADLRAGNDTITVRDLYMASFNLTEQTGNDRVRLSNVAVPGNVNIATTSGGDQVEVSGLFQGNVNIQTGLGDDSVTVSGRMGIKFVGVAGSRDIDQNYVYGGAIGGGSTLNIGTSAGVDNVTLNNLFVDGNVIVDTGLHNDTFLSLNVNVWDSYRVYTRDGVDVATFVITNSNSSTVDMGSGDDLLQIDAFSGGIGVWTLDGGLGVDTLDRNAAMLGSVANFEIII